MNHGSWPTDHWQGNYPALSYWRQDHGDRPSTPLNGPVSFRENLHGWGGREGLSPPLNDTGPFRENLHGWGGVKSA